MNRKYISSIILLCLIQLSCTDLLDKRAEPVGRLTVDNYYVNADGALGGVNGAYNALTTNGNFQEWAWKTDIATDDGEGGDQELENFTWGPIHPFVSNFWNANYTGIYRCNVGIERIPAIAFPPGRENDKGVYLAQLHFLRAFYYFQLVRIFGDVPLIVKEIRSASEAAVERSPKNQVYDQIIADLEEAIRLFQANPVSGYEKGRATIGSSKALLAKVYLTLENWRQAVTLADEVINSGMYQLMPDYLDNFQGRAENNVESVFEVQFSAASGGTGTYTSSYMGAQEVTNTSQGYENNHPTDNTNPPGNQVILTGGLVQEFEPNDIRKGVTMSNYGLKNLNGTPRRLLTNKYFNGRTDPFRQSSINYPIIRYAEVLLIKAEALNEISGGNQEAFDALNAVRERAKLEKVEGLNQSEMRRAIWHERRVELAMEGHRWFDLVRQKDETGTPRLLSVMTAHGRNVLPRHILFPIPQGEIDKNPKMTQNNDY